MGIGIQLYSVREELKQDFQSTLRTLAEIGFGSVEFAFTFGDMPADELSAFLKELDLSCCGVHTDIAQLLDPDSDLYAYVKALGIPFVTTSCLDKVQEGVWQQTVAQLAEVGRAASEQGVRFTYHNHHQEFEPIAGMRALDYLLENTPADLVGAELDTAWAMKGGETPEDYIRRHATRIRQIHLKDFDPDTNDGTELGSGCVDLPAVFAAAGEIGCKHMIYELDESTLGSSLESARRSIQYLKDAGLAQGAT